MRGFGGLMYESMEQSLEKSFAAKSTREAARAVSTSLSHGGAAMIEISPVGDWTISRACKISSSKETGAATGKRSKRSKCCSGKCQRPRRYGIVRVIFDRRHW